jgi:hypothetical protein
MIIDLQTTFSGSTSAAGVKSADAITATAISTNVIDLRQAATPTTADEGIIGAPDMWLIVQAVQAFTAAGAATLTITLESDSAVGLATTPAVHYSTAAIPKATLIAGYVAVRTKLPSGDYQRYIGLRYTVATGPMTAGTVLAWLSPDVQRNITYPNGFSVS